VTVEDFVGELCVRAGSTEVNKNSKAKAKIRDGNCCLGFKCQRPLSAILTGLGLAANHYQEQDIEDRKSPLEKKPRGAKYVSHARKPLR